ncbi:MAG: tetratricopeptide repeat protein [Cyanobacteria bacterium SZAS TMP-1]|nr:tetratricopeptide repeat protein [Cyanobacteria bacterium SZAS TMP-1]
MKMARKFFKSGTIALISAGFLANIPAVAAESYRQFVILNQGIHFGDWRKTRSLCDGMLQKNPQDVDALLARANLNGMTGKTNDALADCNRVLATHPDCVPALNVRAAILWDIGKTKEGQADLKQYLALSKSETDKNTHYWQAASFERLKNYDAAKKKWQELLNETSSTTSDEDLFFKGMAEFRLNKFKESIQTLTTLRKNHPVAPYMLAILATDYTNIDNHDLALKTFAEVAKQAPDFAANQAGWAWEFEKEKKYKDAIAHYGTALTIDKKYLYAYKRRGHCYYSEGDHQAALKDLNKAIQMDPNDKTTIMERVYTYHVLNRNQEAMEDCKRIIAIDPKDAEAYNMIGHSLAHLQKWQDSLEACDKALKLDPKYKWAFYNRARAKTELGQSAKAHADFDAAIKIDSKFKEALYSHGILYRDEKQYPKSIASLTAAIKSDPEDPLSYCARGCAEVRNGNYKECIEDCTKSLKLNSNRLHPHLSRGEAFSALGKYDLALKDLNMVLQHYAFDTEALTERAKLYKKMNKPKLAESDWASLRRLKQPGKAGHPQS